MAACTVETVTPFVESTGRRHYLELYGEWHGTSVLGGLRGRAASILIITVGPHPADRNCIAACHVHSMRVFGGPLGKNSIATFCTAARARLDSTVCFREKFHKCATDTCSRCCGFYHCYSRVHGADGRHGSKEDSGTSYGGVGTRRSHAWCCWRRSRHRIPHHHSPDDGLSGRWLPLRSEPCLPMALRPYFYDNFDNPDDAFHT